MIEGEIIPVDRPDWDTYFMMIANVVSLRSMDAQTKVGSVLVNSQNFILGTGYNSFPKGVDDCSLPNTRPHKYLYISHSEMNCIQNCYTNLQTEKNLTLYCTLRPCIECLKAIVNYDIKRIIYLDRPLSENTAAGQHWFDTLINTKKIFLKKIPVSNLDVYNDIVSARQ